MSKRSDLTESVKKEVAGIQYYKCANKPNSNLDKLENYECPLWKSEKNKGCFDKSGYAVDHIIEYSLTKNNDITNLQALCASCHAVKTKKFMQLKNKKQKINNNKKYDSSHDPNSFNCNCVKCIEDDSDFISHGKNCVCMQCIDDRKLKINTYEDFIKYSTIDDIIITNKAKKLGYIKFKNQFWRQLYDKNADNYDHNMETYNNFMKHFDYNIYAVSKPIKEILGYYEFKNKYCTYKHKLNNNIISYEEYSKINDDEYDEICNCKYTYFYDYIYDYDNVKKDILKKCYKKIKPYELQYYEYALTYSNNSKIFNTVFDAKKYKLHEFDDVKDKIIIHKSQYAEGRLLPDVNADTKIINDILKELVNDTNIIQQFRDMCYNIVVQPSDQTNIFYDSDENYLTNWLIDILNGISGYENYSMVYFKYTNYSFDAKIKKNKRCVVIDQYKDEDLKNIIIEFKQSKIKNIVVKSSDKNIYNVKKFKNYFIKNKKYIQQIIDVNVKKNWMITNNYSLWDSVRYGLFPNFLKWICNF